MASRDDERGVLVLSSFTGASRELSEALIINPYDTHETANALGTALRMPVEEQFERMRLMRQQVRERNVYRWADACRSMRRAAGSTRPLLDIAERSDRNQDKMH